LLDEGKGFLLERLPGVVPVRWVVWDTRKNLSIEAKPENRALNVLFMATSPLGVEPVLNFEGEEARILEATARQPLSLTVEESGCLTELGYLVEEPGKGYSRRAKRRSPPLFPQLRKANCFVSTD
jgi:hypothetical protein